MEEEEEEEEVEEEEEEEEEARKGGGRKRREGRSGERERLCTLSHNILDHIFFQRYLYVVYSY